MTSTDSPLTDQRLDAIAARVADDPFYVSDCEGNLQVWRESALTHVRRDEAGEIEMYSFPSSYRVTDQVIEIDLNSWDPGEDATDDQQRQDIRDLVEARAAMPVLLDTIGRLRAQLVDQADADTVAERAAKAISAMGDDLRAMTSERNRYRNAWNNARARAVDARSDADLADAASAPSGAPLSPVQASSVSESTQSPERAAEGAPGASGPTAPPRRTLTPGEYNAAWHAVEGAAGEEGADPGTILHAVLDRLGIEWQAAARPAVTPAVESGE